MVNGNNNLQQQQQQHQPPLITRRKKNKKNPSATTTTTSTNTTPVINNNEQMLNAQYVYPSFNYTIPTEPVSLPITSNYMNTNPFKLALNYTGNVNPLHFPTALNVTTTDFMQMNEYVSLPIGNLQMDDDYEDDDEEDVRRRYSDPCIPNDTSDSSTNNSNNHPGNGYVKKLTQQINRLMDNQQKMQRDMMEMRIELNVLKQQVCLGGGHTNREYEPGMLSDVIREVRDAARVREDALLARVKHMIEEKELILVSVSFLNDVGGFSFFLS